MQGENAGPPPTGNQEHVNFYGVNTRKDANPILERYDSYVDFIYICY